MDKKQMAIKLVNEKLDKQKGKKVMLFTKSQCPYSKKAKDVFTKLMDNGTLLAKEYEHLDIDTYEGGELCEEIQNYLGEKTGERTVPRVFINGKFIGGGTETADLDKSGELQRMITN